MNTTKVCRDCQIEQPIENFPVYSGRAVPRCRPCQREFKRRYKDGQRIRPRCAGELPAGPFLEWLYAFVARQPSYSEACRILETDERVVWRWMNRPSPFIPESRVDQVFCAVGMPHLLRELYWTELYAHLDELEEAA